jgi:hypothetical protein
LSPGGTDQDQGTPENNLRGHLKLASGYRRPEKLLCSGFVSGIAAVTTGNTCAFRSVQKTMRTSRKLFLIQWKRFRNLTAGLARRNFLWFVVRHEFSNRKFRGSNLASSGDRLGPDSIAGPAGSNVCLSLGIRLSLDSSTSTLQPLSGFLASSNCGPSVPRFVS